MAGEDAVHTDLIGVRSELLAIDRCEPTVDTCRAQLAQLVRRVAFSDVLAANREDRRLARRLIHAGVARLYPLQEAAPPAGVELPASPDEEWLLGPVNWTAGDLAAALERWVELEPVRPHLVLLVPTRELGSGEVVYPLWPDTSARYVGVDASLSLGVPVVLVGSGSPASAVEMAVRRAAS